MKRRGFTLIELLVVIAIYRDFDRITLTRRAEGPRGGRPHAMYEQR